MHGDPFVRRAFGALMIRPTPDLFDRIGFVSQEQSSVQRSKAIESEKVYAVLRPIKISGLMTARLCQALILTQQENPEIFTVPLSHLDVLGVVFSLWVATDFSFISFEWQSIPSSSSKESIMQNPNKRPSLAVGSKYPFPLACYEGASAQFFIDDSFLLQICLPGMLKSEVKCLRSGSVEVGYRLEGFVIIILFRIDDLEFECPFDPRLIPEAMQTTPSFPTPDTRIQVDLHAIDTQAKVLKVLRSFTLPAAFSREIASLVDCVWEGYITEHSAGELVFIPTSSLIGTVKMYQCGRD